MSEFVLSWLSPLGFLILMACVAVLAKRRLHPLIRCVYAIAILMVVIFSLPIVANSMYASLEGVHPVVPMNDVVAVDVIIVLGGSVEPPVHPRIVVELGVAGDRVLHAWRLFRAQKSPLIIVSGGRSYSDSSMQSEAYYMKEVLVELGVPAEKVVLESGSRNTYQNAKNSRTIVGKLEIVERSDETDQHKTPRIVSQVSKESVLLVTSAIHMPRALATFQKAGINAMPATTDIRHSTHAVNNVLAWLPNALSLSQSTDVLREWLAIVFYKLRGWM